MADLSTTTPDKSWRLWGVLGVVAMLVLGAVLGIVVVPVVQGRAGGIDAYTAICRALGVSPGSPARATPPSAGVPFPVTQVSWSEATLGEVYRADRNSGARLAAER